MAWQGHATRLAEIRDIFSVVYPPVARTFTYIFYSLFLPHHSQTLKLLHFCYRSWPTHPTWRAPSGIRLIQQVLKRIGQIAAMLREIVATVNLTRLEMLEMPPFCGKKVMEENPDEFYPTRGKRVCKSMWVSSVGWELGIMMWPHHISLIWWVSYYCKRKANLSRAVHSLAHFSINKQEGLSQFAFHSGELCVGSPKSNPNT